MTELSASKVVTLSIRKMPRPVIGYLWERISSLVSAAFSLRSLVESSDEVTILSLATCRSLPSGSNNRSRMS